MIVLVTATNNGIYGVYLLTANAVMSQYAYQAESGEPAIVGMYLFLPGTLAELPCHLLENCAIQLGQGLATANENAVPGPVRMDMSDRL